MDIYSKEKRSEVMSKVRSRNTKSTELKLIRIFKENHITGWRRTYPMLGKPDFVFPKKRIVIFVDGCFWHGHNCRNVTPEDNAEYWIQKKARNKARDELVTEQIKSKGWTVIRIWECELTRKRQDILENKIAILKIND